MVAAPINSLPVILPIRRTARLIVLDPMDRILLIKYKADRAIEVANPNQRSFWYTPGGGLEAGETHIEAARRELMEETGIVDVGIGQHVANWNSAITLFRLKSRTESQIFLVRAASDRLDTSQLAETEKDPVLDVRWWSLAELKAAIHGGGDYVSPSGLLPLLENILEGHVPSPPIAISCQWAMATV